MKHYTTSIAGAGLKLGWGQGWVRLSDITAGGGCDGCVIAFGCVIGVGRWVVQIKQIKRVKDFCYHLFNPLFCQRLVCLTSSVNIFDKFSNPTFAFHI